MCKLICKDCGKQYDYDVDDFCPKCGSYNPPDNKKGTQIEQDMLARFQDGQKKQDGREKQRQNPPRHQGSATGQRPPASSSARYSTSPSTPRTVQAQYKPHSVGAALEGTRHHGERMGLCDKKETRKARPVNLFVIILLLVVAVNVLPLAGQVIETIVQGITAPVEEHKSAPQEVLFHTVGEPFDLNDVSITVTETWWQDLSALSTYQQDGMDCLAVSVYITGGTRRDDLRIEPPMLTLESGAQIFLNHDSDFAYALKKKASAYNITLSDYQWEDPLYGQFFFFVPQGEENATLVLEEYPAGNPNASNATAVHYVKLSLP